MQTRVLVCDDHPLVRTAMAMTAERRLGAHVSTARDYQEAWSLADEAGAFDLCLVDLQMPGAEPAEGLCGLKARVGGAKIVVVTGSERDEDLFAALDLEVDGFLPKSADAAVFEAAIGLVMAGGRYLPERLATLASPGSARPASSAPPAIEAPLGRLSGRHRQVLAQMAEGLANKEIARRLGVSPATVKTHVAQVIAVMGAANRTEAAGKARSLGLV